MRTSLGGRKVARTAAAGGRGRKSSVYAARNVATHASTHGARGSLRVGRAGWRLAEQAPIMAHPSNLRLLATRAI